MSEKCFEVLFIYHDVDCGLVAHRLYYAEFCSLYPQIPQESYLEAMLDFATGLFLCLMK